MGMAVGPHVGPTRGGRRRRGLDQPFNGEGIAYGYETGRLAAASVGEALAGGGREALALYDERLAHAYADYYKGRQRFVRLISNPQAVQLCVGVGMRSEWLMTQLLRIMSNLMRPDALGPAEVGYRAMEAVATCCPTRSVPPERLRRPPPGSGTGSRAFGDELALHCRCQRGREAGRERSG